MKFLPLSNSRRITTWLWSSLTVVWLAAGCDNPGGVGDGTYDDSIPPGGSTSSAGMNSGRAGTPSATGGASGQNGFAGRAGMSGAAGRAGAAGAGGGAGVGGGAGAGVGGSSAGTSSGGMSGGSVGLGGGGAGPTAGSGPVGCGNGKVDAGEACDSGPFGGSTAGSGGLGGDGSGRGGSGGIEDPSRAGAPPVVATPGQVCSNSCYKVGTQACLECEMAGDCYESVNNCLGTEGVLFTTEQQTLCFSVLKCIQNSNCFDGTDTLGKCYCGALNVTACGAAPFTGEGSPDGPCVVQIKAGFPTLKSNSAILSNLIVPDHPAGGAMKRLSCQKTNVSQGLTCTNACGFTSGGPAFP